MRMPTLTDQEITGRVRFRPGWFGRLIPQAEWRITEYSACPPMPGCEPKKWREQMRAKGVVRLMWRDATTSDLLTLGELRSASRWVAPAEVDRDSDGDLLIDWSPGKGRLLSMSLRDDGRLSYAFLWDGEQSHGTAQMPPARQSQDEARLRRGG